MKKIKIHIWFLINIGAILLLFYGKSFFIGVACLVFLVSPLLLRKWSDIKKEYTSPVSKRYVLIVFGIILLLLISAFSGFAERSNHTFLNQPWVSNALFFALLCLFFIGYMVLLGRRAKEKDS
jgi:hydrogenase-4 membrane subunit HyfE